MREKDQSLKKSQTCHSDLFTDTPIQVVVHKATKAQILAVRKRWYKGGLDYECLIPQKDSKGNLEMCSATYTENEIDFDLSKSEGYKLELELKLKK